MHIDWQTLTPRRPPTAGGGAEPLRAALDACDSVAPFLSGAARGAGLICVNDPHRSTCTGAALEALAACQTRHDMRPRWRVLVATGTHRIDAAERREFEQGLRAVADIALAEIAWHDARDAGMLLPLACCDAISTGEPPRFHRWIHESTHLLGIGSVEPHYFAGLTGAHKTLTIGCLSLADIERNHAGALSPHSDLLRLRGNPVYEGIAGWVRALKASGRRVLALNQVSCAGGIVAAAAGDPLATLDHLAGAAERCFAHVLPATVDLLHLKVPLPLGRSLYQADKALKNNHLAVRDGGGIILDAACPEGVGPDHFVQMLRRAPTLQDALALVAREGYHLGDHKAVKLRALTDPSSRGVRAALVAGAGVSPEVAATCGMRVCPSTKDAQAWLAAELRGGALRGLIIEDAGISCCALRNAPVPG